MLFRERFGPDVLRSLQGSELLRAMHGREDGAPRCLAYWLEFKDDAEFSGGYFGGIGGGAALKYQVFQRSDGQWVKDSLAGPLAISAEEATAMAVSQRDELLAGAAVLAKIDPRISPDEEYRRVQAEMEREAPALHRLGWSHKYWFLNFPDRLDDFHSPRWQRFHLLKMLQMPPDNVGTRNRAAPRFNCAGRFVAAAAELRIPITTLTRVLNLRAPFHGYWRVGTTEGSSGASHWPAMRDGNYVSIGWRDHVPDLTDIIAQHDKAEAQNSIRDKLLPNYPGNAGVATRKAREIWRFAAEIEEHDLVLACEGMTCLGIGRVRGAYEYSAGFALPHKRPVEWMHRDPWQLPERDGLLTTVFELGRSAPIILAIEEALFRAQQQSQATRRGTGSRAEPPLTLAPLDPLAARVDGILKRKGQVVLYGPPGTGKTFHARRVARELAARRAFGKGFDMLAAPERDEVLGVAGRSGLVRMCTFHPGYGYEDFIEGLRPRTVGGQMVFELRDGIFKRLCADAATRLDRDHFLIVDEFNRGDVPRIFGELLTLIERDKRAEPILLPISGAPFAVPPNVCLVATMNTADRSISLLDAALRRRFGFVELLPDGGALAGRVVAELPLGPWLEALNQRLRIHLKRDARNLQVGHSYLLPPRPISSAAEFARVVRDDIVPLLEEYCYDDFDTLKAILGESLIDLKKSKIRDELFADNRLEDLLQALSFPEMQQAEATQPRLGEDAASEDGVTDNESDDNAGPAA